MKNPSPREQQVIFLIDHHIKEQKEAPTLEWLFDAFFSAHIEEFDIDLSETNKWIQEEKKRVRSNLHSIIGRLKKSEKEYIYTNGKRVYLKQSNVNEYLERLHNSDSVPNSYNVISAQVQVRGYVNAGSGVDLDVEYNMDSSYLPIPSIRAGRTVYALKVRGESMVSEGILDGDYVIIEEFSSNEGPRGEDIVVVKYVERSKVPQNDPAIDVQDIQLIGHSLKRYREEWDARGNYILLSRLQNSHLDPFRIEAGRVEFIGRVTDLYRKY